MEKFAFIAILVIMSLTTRSLAQDHPARSIPEASTMRERFLKMIDRPRVSFNAVEKRVLAADGLVETRFAFNSEAGQRVPGIMVASQTGAERRPAVIVLHGTGGSKQAMVPLLREFAQHGVVGVAIDGRFAGDRAVGTSGSDAYRAAILSTWKTGRGFPFYYDTVWDLLRLIDYLESRDDVDPMHFGAMGFSKGGTELYLAAAVDDRLAASVPCIGVQSFGWALENDAWQSRIGTIQSAVDAAAVEAGVPVDAAFIRQFYDRVAPGIYNHFDAPAMLPLIAPRSLLVINGDRDDRTPRVGLELCITPTRKAYEQAHSARHFEFILQPNTAHQVRPESQDKAVEWLVKHLSQVKAK